MATKITDSKITDPSIPELHNVCKITGGKLTGASITTGSGAVAVFDGTSLSKITIERSQGRIEFNNVRLPELAVELNGGSFAARGTTIKELKIAGSGGVILDSSDNNIGSVLCSLKPKLGLMQDNAEHESMRLTYLHQLAEMNAGETKTYGPIALRLTDLLHADGPKAKVFALFKLSDLIADSQKLISIVRLGSDPSSEIEFNPSAAETAVVAIVDHMLDPNPWVRLAAISVAEKNISADLVQHEVGQRAIYDPEPRVIVRALEVLTDHVPVSEIKDLLTTAFKRSAIEIENSQAALEAAIGKQNHEEALRQRLLQIEWNKVQSITDQLLSRCLP